MSDSFITFASFNRHLLGSASPEGPRRAGCLSAQMWAEQVHAWAHRTPEIASSDCGAGVIIELTRSTCREPYEEPGSATVDAVMPPARAHA